MDNRHQLRANFIGMAFAVAVGGIGLEVGDFYSHGLSLLKNFYVFTHLFLATFIVASSWVGWNKSKAFSNEMIVNTIFGIPFILLLIDLFLVICYFIIVNGVEQPLIETEGKYVVANPSAYNESFWSMVIFGFYLLWDFFSKGIIVKYLKSKSEFFYYVNYQFDLNRFVQRGFPTLFCFTTSYIIFKTLADVKISTHVVLVDIALILLFISFRGLKFKIKKRYDVSTEKIEPSNLKELQITTENEIKVIDKFFYLKVFSLRILPVVLLIVIIIVCVNRITFII